MIHIYQKMRKKIPHIFTYGKWKHYIAMLSQGVTGENGLVWKTDQKGKLWGLNLRELTWNQPSTKIAYVSKVDSVNKKEWTCKIQTWNVAQNCFA